MPNLLLKNALDYPLPPHISNIPMAVTSIYNYVEMKLLGLIKHVSFQSIFLLQNGLENGPAKLCCLLAVRGAHKVLYELP